MTSTETTEAAPQEPEAAAPRSGLDVAVRVAPYVVIWTVLLVPTIRTMARGWRPLADDAKIALPAWNTFSLHPPLVGVSTGVAGTNGIQNTANPGPLELWLLGPFEHLDPGQGALLGSALLCAAALTFAVYVLQRTAGTWAAVIFSLVVADLAVFSVTPFVDPVWNASFASIWFLSFMAVAFAVGLGNLQYLPWLIFIGSVTVDSHLSFMPSTVLAFVAAVVCGLLLRRTRNYRWLWWSIGVAVVCWIAPVGQQLFGAQPNGTQLLRSLGYGSAASTKTFGSVLGLHTLSRAASLSPVWATARPNDPLTAYNDVVSNGNLVYLAVFASLVAVIVLAWRHKKTYVLSLSTITTAASVGLVALYARVPANYILSFTWINFVVWSVGVCIWITLGVALVTWARKYVRAPSDLRISRAVVEITALVVMALATVVATVSVMSPSGNRGNLLDFAAMKRVQNMATTVEAQVPQGQVGLGVRYSGPNFFQSAGDERGLAYLLWTAGWTPGLPSNVNGTLDLPIHPASPYVVFTEHDEQLTGFERYPHYEPQALLSPKF